jgi:hypothetical protein
MTVVPVTVVSIVAVDPMVIVITRAGMDAKAEADHGRRRGIDYARGRSRNIYHPRSAFDIYDLWLRLHNLRRDLFDDGRSGGNHRSVVNAGGGLHHRRTGLGVNALSVIDRRLVDGRRRGIHRLLRRQCCANQCTCRRADDSTFGPAVTIMPTNQATRDSAHHGAISHGRPKNLRLGRTGANERERNSHKDGFHSLLGRRGRVAYSVKFRTYRA